MEETGTEADTGKCLGILKSARPVIMGILNVTPDSFSDGGVFLDVSQAIEHGVVMVDEGADIIDVGGESTRPGADSVSEYAQISRVLPVVAGLRQSLPKEILISIDTTRLAVAMACLKAGANLVNDVSAGTDDEEMLGALGEIGAPIVLMHRKGVSKTMQDNPTYFDVVEEVISFLDSRAVAAQEAGIARENIILDPGIGFGKRRADNLRLLAALDRFVSMGYPILLGASRKRFMGSICNEARPAELLGATIATTALGVEKGVKIFRVHDVRPNRQAADVAAAIVAAGSSTERAC